jgi:hypothetical protein
MGVDVCAQTGFLDTNTTIPTDIPGLLFPLLSARRYQFTFKVGYYTESVNTGVGFCFGGPGWSQQRFSVKIEGAWGGLPMVYFASTGFMATSLISAEVVAINTIYEATIEGFCRPLWDGTLQLKACSEVMFSRIFIVSMGIGFCVHF